MRSFEQQIREHAYFIWENEGRVFGHAEDHWLRAEHALHDAAAQMLVPALTLAASPAETLDKTLKARSTRSRGAAAKVAAAPVAKAAPAKVAAKVAAKAPPRAVTAKAATSKPTTAKSAAKAPAAKATARTKAPGPQTEAGASLH